MQQAGCWSSQSQQVSHSLWVPSGALTPEKPASQTDQARLAALVLGACVLHPDPACAPGNVSRSAKTRVLRLKPLVLYKHCECQLPGALLASAEWPNRAVAQHMNPGVGSTREMELAAPGHCSCPLSSLTHSA